MLDSTGIILAKIEFASFSFRKSRFNFQSRSFDLLEDYLGKTLNPFPQAMVMWFWRGISSGRRVKSCKGNFDVFHFACAPPTPPTALKRNQIAVKWPVWESPTQRFDISLKLTENIATKIASKIKTGLTMITILVFVSVVIHMQGLCGRERWG